MSTTAGYTLGLLIGLVAVGVGLAIVGGLLGSGIAGAGAGAAAVCLLRLLGVRGPGR